MTEENGFLNKCEENSEKKKKRKNKHQQQQLEPNQGVKEKVNEEESEENSEKKKKRKNKHQLQELEHCPAVKEKVNAEENGDKSKEKRKNKHHQQQLEQNPALKEKVNEEEKSKEKENIKENTDRVNKDNKKKRKRKEVFPFGNYRSYYGYRIGQGMDEDPRLSVFDRKWFEGKDCLDIGCNSGIVTIQIAKKFHCRKILGIDIDSDRIADAYWHLRKIVRQTGNTHKKASGPDVTRGKKGSKDSTTSLPEEKETVRDGSHPGEIDLFDVVSFKKENFVQSWCHQEEQYDTVLCLSVTKWIHLNWGDEGLITTFSKIWKLLRPGGILVLEPQPWKSYENNRLVSETVTRNYRNIIFRPHHFEEILLDKIGFRKVEDLTSALSGTKAGFDRPIFAYHK